MGYVGSHIGASLAHQITGQDPQQSQCQQQQAITSDAAIQMQQSQYNQWASHMAQAQQQSQASWAASMAQMQGMLNGLGLNSPLDPWKHAPYTKEEVLMAIGQKINFGTHSEFILGTGNDYICISGNKHKKLKSSIPCVFNGFIPFIDALRKTPLHKLAKGLS